MSAERTELILFIIFCCIYFGGGIIGGIVGGISFLKDEKEYRQLDENYNKEKDNGTKNND